MKSKPRVIWISQEDGKLWGAWSYGKKDPLWLLGSKRIKFVEQLPSARRKEKG